MKFKQIIRPLTLKEAYGQLKENDKSILIGGGIYLRLQNREADFGIDLSNIEEIKGIKSEGDSFVIGSMTTLRELETDKALPECIRKAVMYTGGVGLRNLATIGGSVWGRYPFSDINTALLALNARLHFYNCRNIQLEDFLKDGIASKDILVSIEIPKVEYSIIKMFKHNYTDFSMVNICVVSSDEIRIAVGARPGRSVLIENLSNAHTAEELLLNIEFGSDFRGSGEYRRKVAETMLSEILEEGLLWK